MLARYSMPPRKGHLEALQNVFGYLRCKPKGMILLDTTSPPIRTKVSVTTGQEWQEFYPDATENIPDNPPIPQGQLCYLTAFVDADHARDQVSRHSVTGILVLLNNTPIFWYSKHQKTVETSTYGSEIVAARIAIEILIALRYTLRMLGANLEKQSMLVGDNMAVVLNTTIPSSLLKKKHQACNYHKVRESIAGGFIVFGHIPSECNVADLLTKPLGTQLYSTLMLTYLFQQP